MQRLIPFFALLLTPLLIALGVWGTYWAAAGKGQYEFIHLGQSIYEGGQIYVDCWENKPPAVAWLSALGITLAMGNSWGAWLPLTLGALLCVAVFAWVARERLGVVSASLGSILAAVLVSLRIFDTPSIHPDSFSALFSLAAIALWTLALNPLSARHAYTHSVIAGLAFGFSVACNQTGIVGPVVILAVTLTMRLARHPDSARWIRAAFGCWIGVLLMGLGVSTILYTQGALGAAYAAIIEFNLSAVKSWNIVDAITSWPRWVNGLQPLQLPLWLALLGILAGWGNGSGSKLGRPWVLTLLLWFLAEAVLALIDPSPSLRFWQATFPPLLWLAALGVFQLESACRELVRTPRSVFVVAYVSLAFLLGKPLFDHYRHGVSTSYLAYSTDHSERKELKAVGRRIAELVPPNEKIFVWAREPGIYVHADRICSSRFTYPRSADQMQEILADLAARKPYAVLIGDLNPPEFAAWCDAECHLQRVRWLSMYPNSEVVGTYRLRTRTGETLKQP